MLEDGLSYPLRGDWIGRVIIGGVLGFLSVLVLPAFVLLGYLVRVLETTVDGSDDPPEFVDWGELLVTGVVGTVITLAYTVVPIVGYVLLVVVLVGTGGAVGGDLGALVGVAGLLVTLALIPVVLVVYYAVPAALTAYAAHGEIGAAFDLAALKPTLFSTEYLVAVFMPLVVAVGLWIATGLLAITIVGLLFVPFLQFYGQMAVFRMFGSAFASETDRIDAGPAEAPDLVGR